MTFRTYHDVPDRDRSGLAEQVRQQRARVTRRLQTVRRVVGVMSGKGGVGKSYVTAGLALGAATRLPGDVGVLDADLNGPTAAMLLGASGPVTLSRDAVAPAVGEAGIRVFSTDLLLEDGQPVRWDEPDGERFVWRGTLETGALREFLGDVAWGNLELLLVDLPPGSARVQDMAALVPDMRGLVAVTIPAEESRRSVARAMRAAREHQIPLLGVVENMSGYGCVSCGTVGPLFAGDAGARLATEFAVPLLGRIPFHVMGDAPRVPGDVLERFLGVMQ